jgi:hypothetical protein
MYATLAKTIVSATPHTTSCEVAGETVILDAASGQYFALNPVGTSIWQQLQSPRSVGSLCEMLRAEYDVPAEQCEADVSALLVQLAAKGLIRMGP